MHALLLLLLAPSIQATPMYTVYDLGARTNAAPLGLSSDGQYAVGGQTSWIWTQSTGFQNLSTLTGGSWQEARGVTSSGVAAGYSSSPAHTLHWDGSTLTATAFGGTTSNAFGINNAGVMVGSSFSPQSHLYRWDAVNGIAELRSEISGGWGINDSGDATGFYLNGSGQQEAIAVTGSISVGGTLTPLGQLSGGTFSRGRSINDSQEVAGEAFDASGNRVPVLWLTPGSPAQLAQLGRTNGIASGINDSGLVVGTVYGGLAAAAVLWDAGTGFTLDSRILSNPGWQVFDAVAINDAGQILASARINGVEHVIRLDPILTADSPEPSTLLVVSLALGIGLYYSTSLRRSR
ncbi:MAG: hypothetical protein U0R19_39665 [Bryobacteraceae bacterium]